jgi:serine/threonine-protein kinase
MAHVHLHFTWDWPAAEREFQRAVELNPNNAPAHHWFSHFAMAMGRLDTSLVESRRCLELDPMDIVNNCHLSWHYWLAGQPDEAIEQGRRTSELYPAAFMPEYLSGLAYEAKAMPGDAIEHFRRAAQLSSSTAIVLAALGHAHALAGERAQALKLLADLEALGRERYVPAYDRAIVHAGLQNVDRALDCLQEAHAEHSSWMSYLAVEPRLDGLRGEARFQDLIAKLRLPVRPW